MRQSSESQILRPVLLRLRILLLRMSFLLTGGCGCGAVRFEITEPLVGSVYCHCRRCQRRTGVAASATARVAPGSFTIVQGEDRTYRVEWIYGRDPYPSKVARPWSPAVSSSADSRRVISS